MSLNTSNIYLILYILIWVITLYRYQKNKHIFDAGSFIIGSYIIYAVFSLFLYNNKLVLYDKMQLFPFLYLYAMLIIALYPIMKYDESKIHEIQKPSGSLLNIMSVIIIISSLIPIPSIITHFREGLMQIIVDSQIGDELYKTSLSNADNSGIGISNIPAIISGALSDICILLFFYYLTLSKKNKIIIIGLFLSCIISMILPISNGQRGGTINRLMTFIVAYYALKAYFPPDIKRKIKTTLFILAISLFVPILLITNSRFGERDGGALFSIVNYAGQANLNFNEYGLDAGGIRYGDRTINLFKSMVVSDVPKNFMERRTKYSHLKMNDDVFYTFVGDFTLDYGPYIALVIFILFTLYVNKRTRIKGARILFHQLLLLFFVMCICTQGGMTLFTYSDIGGNLKIIVFFIAYICFKYDYYLRKTIHA